MGWYSSLLLALFLHILVDFFFCFCVIAFLLGARNDFARTRFTKSDSSCPREAPLHLSHSGLGSHLSHEGVLILHVEVKPVRHLVGELIEHVGMHHHHMLLVNLVVSGLSLRIALGSLVMGRSESLHVRLLKLVHEVSCKNHLSKVVRCDEGRHHAGI